MSADPQFKQLIDRILRCREAEEAAKDDTKEVYSELKGFGYDKTVAGTLVNELRKREKNPDKFEEASTVLDLYRDAYERASGTKIATHTHEEFPLHEDNPSIGMSAYLRKEDFPSHGDGAGEIVEQKSDRSPASTGHSSSLATHEADKAVATIPEPFEPPSFLVKERQPLRPLCLNPSNCAGYGTHTCHRCLKATGEAEVAA